MNPMNTTQTLTKKGKSPLPKNGNRIAVQRRDDSDDASLLLDAMLAFRNGDFTARVPSNWTGVYGKIADVFNEDQIREDEVESDEDEDDLDDEDEDEDTDDDTDDDEDEEEEDEDDDDEDVDLDEDEL